MHKTNFRSESVSTADIRTKTQEILAPIKTEIGGVKWTFHGKVQAVVLPPQGGTAMLHAYEIGTPRSDAIAHALNTVLAANADGNPRPLVEVLSKIVDEIDFYERAKQRGFMSTQEATPVVSRDHATGNGSPATGHTVN